MASDTGGKSAGALIIGASSGIGAALARRLVPAGYRVALVARRQDALDALRDELNAGAPGAPVAFAYPHDVRLAEDTPALFSRIAADVAPLELVIYAAGIMPHIKTGESFEAERAVMETNVVGALRWLGLAADYFEARKRGTLVGVSSVAGERGRPGNGAYMASKAALTSYLDSLRYRLKSHRVRVITVKPGYVASEMTQGLKLPRLLTISADDAARRILRAAARGRPVAYIPAYWGAIMWLVRAMPSSLVARLPG